MRTTLFSYRSRDISRTPPVLLPESEWKHEITKQFELVERCINDPEKMNALFTLFSTMSSISAPKHFIGMSLIMSHSPCNTTRALPTTAMRQVTIKMNRRALLWQAPVFWHEMPTTTIPQLGTTTTTAIPTLPWRRLLLRARDMYCSGLQISSMFPEIARRWS